MLNYVNEKVVFEDLIFEGTKESSEKAQKMMKNFLYQNKWIQSLLNFGAFHRPFSFKHFAMLFKCTGKPKIKFSQIKIFPHYLYLENIISKEDFVERVAPGTDSLKDRREYENPLQSNYVTEIIANDDIHTFVNLFNFDDMNIDKQFVEINGWSFSLKWLASYCGAMNILKCLIINGAKIDRCTIVKAVQGGSEECIQFLESKGHTFDGTLRLAIEYHQNKIAEWLYENYNDDGFTLPFCVENFNTHMLLYLIRTGNVDINEQDATRKTSLHWAFKCGDYLLADYLLFSGADKTIKELYGKKAFDYIEKKQDPQKEKDKYKCKRSYKIINRDFQQLESCCLLI